MFSNSFKELATKCLSCNRDDHRMGSCPYLNFLTQNYRVFHINKLIYSKPQNRLSFRRKNKKKYNTLKDRKNIQRNVLTARFNKELMNAYSAGINKGTPLNDDILPKKCFRTNSCDNLELSDEYELEKTVKRHKSTGEIPSLDPFQMSKLYTLAEQIKCPKEFEKKITSASEKKYLKESFKTFFDLESLEKNFDKPFFKKSLDLENLEKSFHLKTISSDEGSIKKKQNKKSTIQEKRGMKELVVSVKDSDKEKQKTYDEESEKNSPLTLNSYISSQVKGKGHHHPKELYFFEFERMKEFSKYFQKNNCTQTTKTLEKKKNMGTSRKTYRYLPLPIPGPNIG